MRRRSPNATPDTPALARLGLAAPAPFVGRTAELEQLAAAMSSGLTLEVVGAVGAGKTRLAAELASGAEQDGFESAIVSCLAGELAASVIGRAESAFRRLPGTMARALRDDALLLVLDDVHHLPDRELGTVIDELCIAGCVGRVAMFTRTPLAIPHTAPRFELRLEGLDEAAARDLFGHLEDSYGPTPAGSSDSAITATRGMPLALRREYARAAFGKDAWDRSALSDESRRSIDCLAVLQQPAAPAAITAMDGLDPVQTESALVELLSKQWVDPDSDGRFRVHAIVRDAVLSELSSDRRAVLERAAAELVAPELLGCAERPGFRAGDDGAVAPLSAPQQLRAAVVHLLSAGDAGAACDAALSAADACLVRGANGQLEDAVLRICDADADARQRLAGTRALMLLRCGRVAEAALVGGLPPLRAAELAVLAGETERAEKLLASLSQSDDLDEVAQSSALLAQLLAAQGALPSARDRIATALAGGVTDQARGALQIAHAQIEHEALDFPSARAALARAHAAVAGDSAGESAVELLRARSLARQGRLREAADTLEVARRSAVQLGGRLQGDRVVEAEAFLLRRSGLYEKAVALYDELVADRRRLGNEFEAVRADVCRAEVLALMGEVRRAAEAADASRQIARALSLPALELRARLVSVAIDIRTMRLSRARAELARIAENNALTPMLAQRIADQQALLDAYDGVLPEPDSAPVDHLLAAKHSGAALDAAKTASVDAERDGRLGHLASALALAARLQLARGDRMRAQASASRAARESLSAGNTAARVLSLLVLAALAREDGDVTASSTYAQDAFNLASTAGLTVERLAAARALEVISGCADDLTGDERESAAAATMSDNAIECAQQILCDLGLTASRPYRVVRADGTESRVSDASPGMLRMHERDLVVDAVREVIVRRGEDAADLRRRSLLKRLLFLFAAEPDTTFSKEEIVEKVWEVEYHPLRHDAALFTNIMRIRRLLGEDGAELLRVSDDGYRFAPGRDYLYVEEA